MTLNLMWANEDTAFVLADSLVTDASRLHEIDGLTSYGEPICKTGPQCFERAMKVFRLPRATFATACGEEPAIRALMDVIAATLQASPDDPVEALLGRVAAEHREAGVESAFVAMHDDARPTMYKLQGGFLSRMDPHEPHVDGARVENLPEMVKGLLKSMTELRGAARSIPAPYDLADLELAIVSGALRASSVLHPLTAAGIGGTFVAGIVDHRGTRWPRPMSYLLWQPHADAIEFVASAGSPGPTTVVYERDCCWVKADVPSHDGGAQGQVIVMGNRACGAPPAEALAPTAYAIGTDAAFHERAEILVISSPFTRRVAVLLRPDDGWRAIWRIERLGEVQILDAAIPGDVALFLNGPIAPATDYNWEMLIWSA